MGPFSKCGRDYFSVNFVHHHDETLHQQIDSMFRSDFNKSIISSEVAKILLSL